ncbi:MAG TPA: YggS family pyridoxal phosphate-dependent enzyme [Spirochaetota bacterium]|nr:YggS family pyridoxal phosphate-dependent enzyme [Spirochaetota bacterium]
MDYFQNYSHIRNRIDDRARAAGRNPENIRIVAVSKTFPPEALLAAIDQGIRLFGESKVQEAKGKIPALSGDFSFHLVGHLQSNKARDAVRLFDLIHSIDKAPTARRVGEEAARIGKMQRILIQVNTSDEDTKSGIDPSGAFELCGEVASIPGIELMGLMTIGPLGGDERAVRASFALLRELRDDIARRLGVRLDELSMGMSGDYLTAVDEGATLVRIGSAIFGERSYGE